MQRLNCERFPCHGLDQDCSLCFCPFYPCGDTRTGGRIKEGAWSCERCTVIHRPDVAGRVLDALMNGDAVPDVWKRLEGLL